MSWDLVGAARQGDKDSFAELYIRYLPLVAGYLSRRTRDRHLVEDLTSETFTKAWRGIGSVTDQGRDIGAWLVTIARNLMIDHAKAHRTWREVPVSDAGVLADEAIGTRSRPDREGQYALARQVTPQPPAPGVDEIALASLGAVELARQVDVLVPAQRDVIRHRYLEGLSLAETATALGCRESTVKARQHRGVTRLRTALTGETAA